VLARTRPLLSTRVCWRVQSHAEQPSRTIPLNDAAWVRTERHRYASNKIFTAKYNVVTFLPKFLFEQFMRLANFYFLVISIIQVRRGAHTHIHR
jgi:hypothetical protein